MPIVDMDEDEAGSLSNKASKGLASGELTLTWAIARGPGGWYLSAAYDNGHDTGPYTTDDGPYRTEADAYMGGMNAAVQFMLDQDAQYSVADYKKLVREQESLVDPRIRPSR